MPKYKLNFKKCRFCWSLKLGSYWLILRNLLLYRDPVIPTVIGFGLWRCLPKEVKFRKPWHLHVHRPMSLQLLQEAITKIFSGWLDPRDSTWFDTAPLKVWFHEKKRVRPTEICCKLIYVIWLNIVYCNIISLLSFSV